MSGPLHTLTESDLVSGNQEWEKHKHEIEPDFFRAQVAPSQEPTVSDRGLRYFSPIHIHFVHNSSSGLVALTLE